MHRYWITFEDSSEPSILNRGAGITAISETDAREIAKIFDRPIVKIDEILDMRIIDQKHVALNMGNHFQRGVWFPLGTN
jgi:hypothetical protein